MPTQVCASCGSGDTGAMLDTFTCHACGAVTNYNGELVSAPTTTPGVEGPAVVTVSPADSADPDSATRTVTATSPGDQFVSTETVSSAGVGRLPQAEETTVSDGAPVGATDANPEGPTSDTATSGEVNTGATE